MVYVLTFSPHPVRILAPQAAPPLICNRHDKRRLLKGAGVDGVLEQTFTKKFAALSPNDFVERVLARSLRAKHVVVGYDFSFGARRAGRTTDLISLGEQHGFAAHVISAQQVEDVEGAEPFVASSSAIRAAVAGGRLEQACQIMGRPFHVPGTVVQGDQRGRLIGFPTANLGTEHELLPQGGVYAGWLDVDGTMHPAVINVGTKPTFDGEQLTIEAHAIDVEGLDLYGKAAHVYFERRLRAEQRFDGIDALVAQIGQDRDAARVDLQRRSPPDSLMCIDVPLPTSAS